MNEVKISLIVLYLIICVKKYQLKLEDITIVFISQGMLVWTRKL